MAFVVIAAFAAIAPSMASAAITSTASTTYGSTVPGAHTDYTIRQDFEYDAGTEPQPGTNDLKKWIVDSPAGLAGNPNAIPEADRCDPAAFDPTPAPAAAYSTFFTGSCPDSAQVGVASVYLVNDAQSGTCPNAPIICLSAGFDMSLLGSPLQGKIYLLKTTPEVPTTLGTLFSSVSYQNFDFSAFGGNVCTTAPGTPCAIQPKTKSILAPVTSGTDGDFRIRTIPAEYSNPPTAILPTAYGHAALPGTPLHIRRIDQHLYGMVDPAETPGNPADDVPFLTMPTRCSNWDSYSYAFEWANNTGTLSMDPNNPGDLYTKSAADSVSPDCSSVPPLNATAAATLSTNTRDSNPQLDVVVTNPTAPGTDLPKSITTTLPASVTTDLQNAALGNIKNCDSTAFNAGTCPAASKVGTAKIETPLITAGLTADVYAVDGASAVPDLGIDVAGAGNAINFKLKGTSTFVGARGNQIQTTFDNLPQTAFTKFTVTIAGGTDSLLTISKCPETAAPEDGPITFSMNGYSTGNTASSSTATSFAGCYGRPVVKKITKCVKYKLTVKPSGYVNEANIAKVELYVGTKSKRVTKRYTKDTKAPFRFAKRLGNKFKKGKKYYMRVKVTYKPTVDAPSGKVVYSRATTFKRCK